MKSFKKFSLQEADMTDMDIAVYPDKVKYDSDGAVKSYKIVVKLEGDKDRVLKDAKLEKSIVDFLGDDNIRSELAVNPKAMMFNVEVYADKKGMYVELGNKKVYFKG